MKFLIRTGLATGVIAVVLALFSVSWSEYSARSSCASVSSTSALGTIAGGARATLIGEVLPEYHIGEKHSVFIDAPPERVFGWLESAGGYERPVVRLFGLLAVIAGNENAPVPSRERSPSTRS